MTRPYERGANLSHPVGANERKANRACEPRIRTFPLVPRTEFGPNPPFHVKHPCSPG
jgi:hypothetical protein